MQADIKNDLLYLLRIIEAAEKIKIYAQHFKSSQEFFLSNNQLEFNASLNQLAQIGEQSKKISNELINKYGEVSWSEIKGFRNRIIHEYIGIEVENVFHIIQNDLPELKYKITNIISKELTLGNFDMEEFEIAKTSPYLVHVDFTII